MRPPPSAASVAWRFGRIVVFALLLAACSPAAETPGAASASEERALNEAAASLDANAADSNAAEIVDDDTNQEQPQ